MALNRKLVIRCQPQGHVTLLAVTSNLLTGPRTTAHIMKMKITTRAYIDR